MFYENFSVFGQIANLRMHKISSKTFTLNSAKLSWKKFHNYLACEFTAHYAWKNAEINLKSTTTNGFNFRIINNGILRRYALPGLTVSAFP